MEALGSSETSVLTKATRHNIPEDGILQLSQEPKCGTLKINYFFYFENTNSVCPINVSIPSHFPINNKIMSDFVQIFEPLLILSAASRKCMSGKEALQGGARRCST
jgi:hypothetical protein